MLKEIPIKNSTNLSPFFNELYNIKAQINEIIKKWEVAINEW